MSGQIHRSALLDGDARALDVTRNLGRRRAYGRECLLARLPEGEPGRHDLRRRHSRFFRHTRCKQGRRLLALSLQARTGHL